MSTHIRSFIYSTNISQYSTALYMIIKTQYFLSGPRREKTCLRGSANNKGTDQPAHTLRLINAFVIRLFGKYHT